MDRVVSGQKVSIRAEVWNKIVGLAESCGDGLGNAAGATPSRGRHLLVVNRGGETLPRYSAVEIGGADNAADTADEPVLTASPPSGRDAPFAVLLEPAPPGAVVRAAISGVARAKAVGSAGSFGGPSGDGTITEGGSGAARILVPGDPGVVLLNAGAGRSYRPFEAWVNYQAAGDGWTLWFVEGQVYYWGPAEAAPEEEGGAAPSGEDGGAAQASAAALVAIPGAGQAEGGASWTISGRLWRTGVSRGTWYLALVFSYDSGTGRRPASWSAAVVEEEAISEAQADGRPKYYPLAKFTVPGHGPSSGVEFTQLRSGMVIVPSTPGGGGAATPSDPEFFATVGADAEGGETADAGTWEYGQTDSHANPLGLKLWFVSRVVYNEQGTQTLYAFARCLTFSQDGLLYSVSAERRFVVDTPVGYP